MRLPPITTVDDLARLCTVDTAGGCWIATKPRLAVGGRCRDLGGAVGFLVTGRATARGSYWASLCGRALCCNPAHRELRARVGQHVGGRKAKSPTKTKPAERSAGGLTAFVHRWIPLGMQAPPLKLGRGAVRSVFDIAGGDACNAA